MTSLYLSRSPLPFKKKFPPPTCLSSARRKTDFGTRPGVSVGDWCQLEGGGSVVLVLVVPVLDLESDGVGL